MRVTFKETAKSLEKVGRGDYSPAESFAIIHDALNYNDEDFRPYVYAALSAGIWRLLASRSYNDELVDWFDAYRSTETLLRVRGEAELAFKVQAFSELLAKSHRFAEAQPAADVAGRKHVREILELLKREGPLVSRQRIIDEVRLLDANLSRVMLVLTTNGLVERVPNGREAFFSITRDGAAVLTKASKPNARVASQLEHTVAASLSDYSFPMAVWDSRGQLSQRTAAFTSLADGVGCNDDAPTLTDWLAKLETFADRRYDDNIDEVVVGERTIAIRSEKLPSGESLLYGFDVTSYSAREDASKQALDEASAEIAELEANIANIRSAMASYKAASKVLRQQFLNSVKRHQKVLVRSNISKSVSERKAIDYLTGAVPFGIEHLLLPPSIAHEENARPERVDSFQLINSVLQGVEQVTDRNIDVKYQATGSLMGHPKMLENSLGVMTAMFMIGFDATQTPKLIVKDDNGSLFLVFRGALAKETQNSRHGVFGSGSGASYCHQIANSFGGDVSFKTSGNDMATAEVRMPSFVSKERAVA